MNSDPYDVYSYESADEFAAEMQHDREFDDYDDAFSYWEEKHWSKSNSISSTEGSTSTAGEPETDFCEWLFDNPETDDIYEDSYNYAYSQSKSSGDTSDDAALGWLILIICLLVSLWPLWFLLIAWS